MIQNIVIEMTLQHRAINNENIFEALMDVCKVCSLRRNHFSFI